MAPLSPQPGMIPGVVLQHERHGTPAHLHGYRLGVHSFQQQNGRAGVAGCRVPVRVRQASTFRGVNERRMKLDWCMGWQRY
jgi:hypothetical protein